MKLSNNKNLLEKTKNYFQNKTIIVLIWIITITLASLITIVNGFNILISFYKNSIGYKSTAYNKVYRIHPNQNIINYYEILGKPSVIKELKLGNNQTTKQYIFTDKYFYISALTDNNSNVSFLAITSRTKDFQPEFNRWGIHIKLNVTKFTDVAKDILIDKNMNESDPMCFTFAGASKFEYYEGYYGPHSDNYQSFYIGINETGIDSNENSKSLIDFASNAFIGDEEIRYFGDCLNIPQNFRNDNKINTYIITSPFEFDPISLKKLHNEFRFGPSIEDVFSL